MPQIQEFSAFRDRSGFGRVDTWIFDLDNTLYPVECRLFDQVDRRMTEFIAGHFSIAQDAARAMQKDYWKRYGTTLKGLMLHHGVAPETYLDFVHRIDLSQLDPDPALDAALARLPGRKIIFTNGPAHHARAVLDRLGIARRFESVFDIAACNYAPKPEMDAYRNLLSKLGADPERCVLFEDTVENLAPAAALGMRTVLVAPRGRVAETRAACGTDVHHVTDELAAFLAAAMAMNEARSRG
jgi:putative hydrolase of the HAD superfamily